MPAFLSNLYRVAHAVAGNLVAVVSPGLYFRINQDTGRGDGQESAAQIADYFWNCFQEYFVRLEVAPEAIEGWLKDKTLLEYGPGDVPAVALLMVAHGADKVWCVDRFELVRLSPVNITVLRLLMERLSPDRRTRAEACFQQPGDPASGLRPERIAYRVSPSGLSGLSEAVDLAYSRAVMEHVDDLDATYSDMCKALKADGLALHQVDLASHRMHRSNRLDFLTDPPWLWSLMHSHKGAPNRWRLPHHLASAARAGLAVLQCEATKLADAGEVRAIRPALPPRFRALGDNDLACLGFWLLARRTDP